MAIPPDKPPFVKLGPRGESLIKSYETLRLKSYLPTPDDVPTIGWGHTKGVKLGQKITPNEAEMFFASDTADATNAVDRLLVKMSEPLTQSMVDALISLVFNVGPGAITSLSTIGSALIAGDYYRAWRGFALWTKQGKKDLLGLARRRAKEMVLFLEDDLP